MRLLLSDAMLILLMCLLSQNNVEDAAVNLILSPSSIYFMNTHVMRIYSGTV